MRVSMLPVDDVGESALDFALALQQKECVEVLVFDIAMAPRSLRRRLEEEGTSFRDIVETERRQLAVQLLQDTHIKLDEIAPPLGSGDTPSFTRAFRRWFGQAPGEYRKLSGT